MYIKYFLKEIKLSPAFSILLLWKFCTSFSWLKEIRKGFLFLQKKKNENCVQHLLNCNPQEQEWPCQAPPPEPTLSTSTPSHHSFELSEYLCFISIYFMHPLIRCILRYVLLWFKPLWLPKVFIGTLSFLVSGEACNVCLWLNSVSLHTTGPIFNHSKSIFHWRSLMLVHVASVISSPESPPYSPFFISLANLAYMLRFQF